MAVPTLYTEMCQHNQTTLYDWDAMPPDQYAEEYGKAFGKEKVQSQIGKVISKTKETIDKLEKDMENSSDPNEQLSLKRKADALKARLDGFDGVLKGLATQTEEDIPTQEKTQENPQGEAAEATRQTAQTETTEEAPTREELDGWQRTTMDTLVK